MASGQAQVHRAQPHAGLILAAPVAHRAAAAAAVARHASPPAEPRRPAAQEQRVNLANSIKLQRNMMKMVFGELAYQRQLFPEDCFEIKEMGGNHIHTLSAESDNVPAAVLLPPPSLVLHPSPATRRSTTSRSPA